MIHQKNQLLLIGNTDDVYVGLEEEVADTFVIQEAAAKAERQGAGFDLKTGEILHFLEDDTQKSHQPAATAFGEPIVPEIPVVSEVISLRVFPQPATITEEFPPSIQDPAQGLGEGSGKFPPHLVGTATEERINVVTSEIQKLEEQLVVLKAKQTTILSQLYQQIEEVKKANLEMEDAESQLANNNIVLAESTRIFTIMQTYHSQIISLGEDVNLLG
ncbi:TMV resistance protein N-like [Pyrus ussuriensis x Pyrus communis]|uniref:TMV resistance protein N-like n=1 Tax=Pyrus ussuriensis x Pyrus communis TaxID=2448454 RepID=A0A5N5GZB0_9ROSA|nr:TMV resistance protein N-like [Pyrus ussuriensis x Pyrus communis]